MRDKDVTDLNERILELQAELGRVTAELNRVTPELDKATAELDRVIPELDKATAELDRVIPELDRVTTELSAMPKSPSKSKAKIDMLKEMVTPQQFLAVELCSEIITGDLLWYIHTLYALYPIQLVTPYNTLYNTPYNTPLQHTPTAHPYNIPL